METPAPAIEPRTLSIDERRAKLQRSINWYSALGYRITTQLDTSAQMVRPKQFSCAIASLTFFCFGIGVLFYLFAYMAMSDSTVYIDVDEDGIVTYNGRVPAVPREGVPPGRSLFTEIGETLQGSTMGKNIGQAWQDGGTPERAAIAFGFGAMCLAALFILALPILLLMQ